MKTAIYVEDRLWNAAVDMFPSDGSSALVQRALRALLRSLDGSPELDSLVEDVGFDVLFGSDDDA